MARFKLFEYTGGLKPGKSLQNLGHHNTVTMTFGELTPVTVLETLPGDVFNLDMAVIGHLTSALVAPAFAHFDLVFEAFYVPDRLLMGSDANFDTPVGERNFEELIVGGKTGNEDIELPLLGRPVTIGSAPAGFTPSFDGVLDSLGEQVALPDGTQLHYEGKITPHALIHRGIRWIWNEYYRADFLEDEIQVCQYLGDGGSDDNTFINDADYDKLLKRAWRRDRFTSGLPFQQFGDSPALPIDILGKGYLNLEKPVSFKEGDSTPAGAFFSSPSYNNGGSPGRASGDDLLYFYNESASMPSLDVRYSGVFGSGSDSSTLNGDYARGYVNGSDFNAFTFDISDLRTAFQIQKWKERNARGGIRYTEYLQAHFGTSPGDARLQRPYFISAGRVPWYNQEVVQTSASVDGSDQGNQAGQSVALGRLRLGKFRSMEFGYIVILASVLPKAQYQQGLSRHFMHRSRFDFFSPEFGHLSEQAIHNAEIFVSGDEETDMKEFGFAPIWDELRFIPSKISRHVRTNAPNYSFDYWTQARYFAETPVLNEEFLTVAGTEEGMKELMKIFPVQNEHPFIVECGFNFTASRPIPSRGEPGLVDHF